MLLSTIRFLRAFLSPVAGGFLVSFGRGFLLIFKVAFFPFVVASDFLIGIGMASWVEVEEKGVDAATRATRELNWMAEVLGLERHFQQLIGAAILLRLEDAELALSKVNLQMARLLQGFEKLYGSRKKVAPAQS